MELSEIATLPAVADKFNGLPVDPFVEITKSAVTGRFETGAGEILDAAWIRKYVPGATELFGSATEFQLVPVAEAYCTEYPLRLIAELVGL